MKISIRPAKEADFEIIFSCITRLWDYNSYDREETRAVFRHVLNDPASFMHILEDQGRIRGFCHGDYFMTFWMSGKTCYISSLFVNPEDRGKGYGRALLGHTQDLARQRGCRAMVLDSGLSRREAHRFYEKYGFVKSCYGFELALP